MLEKLAKLLPLFLILLLVSSFSAQADDALLGLTHGAIESPPQSHDTALTCDGNGLGMANPAAVYCHELGYEYRIVDTDEGQHGTCAFPDGSECNEWRFLQGKCAQSYSYCATQGYDLITKTDGRNPLTREYSVCVHDQEEIGAATELMGLSEKATKGSSPVAQSASPPEGGVSAVGAPPSFDWRNYGEQDWMTPVKNQGSCGSCWAFSAVGVVEAIYNIATGDPTLDLDLSEQQLVSNGSPCCGVCGDCDGGWPSTALAYIRDTGIADEDCFPYTATTAYCALCADWQAGAVTVDETGYVAPSLIKAKVVDTGPLSVAMGYGPDYGGHWDWDGDIYRCTLDSGANHAVIIAGYNNAGGYWIVKNSWGTSWPWPGAGGYFKVGYGECFIEQRVNYADLDTDGDGVPDTVDNCPETHNPGQEDYDGDGVPGTQPPPGATWGGDACDDDDDNDTVPDGEDANPLDEFTCRDVDADTCDDCSVLGQPDVSQDGTDTDSDGACDASDVCTNDPNNDADSDGICVGSGYLPPKTGDNDNCPDVSNPSQENADGDEWGDACDNCPDTATPWYVPAGDDDCDGFTTAVETTLSTDPLDACPDNPTDDAWPLDINMDKYVSAVGDVLNFRGHIGAEPDDPEWVQRLDLNMDSYLSAVGDVLMYRGMIGDSCT